MCWPPIGSATRSNRCYAFPHLAAPQGPPRARACGLIPSLPRSALAPQTALWGWRAGSSRACHHMGLPAPDWRLGTSRGCSAHVALATRTLPPALDAPPQGLASILVVCCSITAPAMGVCGPARRWTSGAGTARAGRARSCLVELAWAGRIPWGLGAPSPLPGRSGWSFEWSFTGGCVLLRAGLGGGHCPRTACWDSPWEDFPLWTSPGSRKRLPGLVEQNLSPHGEQAVLGLGQWPRDPRVSRCSTQPSEKNLQGKTFVCFFSTPEAL